MEKILIAEDDNVSRKLLEVYLKNWGFEVISTRDGIEAWDILQQEQSPQIAILDWMMPRLDGVEVCKRLRQLQRRGYIYIILLTAKGMIEDIVTGLQAGADDYLTKPFDKLILKARINVGLRVVQLERTKLRQLDVITKAHQEMKKDLAAAAHVQMGLLPNSIPSIDGFDFSWVYRPSDALGGDMLDLFPIQKDYVGFYVLDVSGHGTQAALLSVSVCQQLSNLIKNIVQDANSDDSFPSPKELVGQLASHFSDQQNRTGQYFTLLYGDLNTKTGDCRYVCAGHPAPLQYADGEAKEIKSEFGFPIGMFDWVDYQENYVKIRNQEALIFYTDGVIEVSRENEEYGIDRFKDDLIHSIQGGKTLNEVLDQAQEWNDCKKFDDDVTILQIVRS
ncbi:MAG: sigma-B regulation protein RsbU (phosphoserine phosphatase) [bacterium]|jgi:sigma-B regulation protein RsbU (phosphoserine phosphatase)